MHAQIIESADVHGVGGAAPKSYKKLYIGTNKGRVKLLLVDADWNWTEQNITTTSKQTFLPENQVVAIKGSVRVPKTLLIGYASRYIGILDTEIGKIDLSGS